MTRQPKCQGRSHAAAWIRSSLEKNGLLEPAGSKGRKADGGWQKKWQMVDDKRTAARGTKGGLAAALESWDFCGWSHGCVSEIHFGFFDHVVNMRGDV